MTHEADLELARQCASGDERAWERFVLEYRPILYRAADALDHSGSAREIADALYAELYGLKERDGERQSLFRYFHGRSSLATWLRAVLAQRFVDRQRAQRRLEPLPELDGDAQDAGRAIVPTPDPDRTRLLALARDAVRQAIARLGDRDRLRLGCYYVQQLTLAQTGRVLKEHEATASRQLARTRDAIRRDAERLLSAESGLSAAEVARCLALAADDPGTLDLAQALGAGGERKKSELDRSI